MSAPPKHRLEVPPVLRPEIHLVTEDESAYVALEDAIQTILRVERVIDRLRGEQHEKGQALISGQVKRRDRQKVETFVQTLSRACLDIEEALAGEEEGA